MSLPPIAGDKKGIKKYQSPSIDTDDAERRKESFHRRSVAESMADEEEEEEEDSRSSSNPDIAAAAAANEKSISLSKSHQEEGREKLFSVIGKTASLLKERREEQDRQVAEFLANMRKTEETAEERYTMAEEIQAISATSEVGLAQKKGFYYDNLTVEEEKMLDALVLEVQEIKARRKVKYDPSTVQGSFALLLQMDCLTEFGIQLYEQLAREEVYIPVQMARMTRDERITAIFRIINICVSLYDKPNDMFETLVAEGTRHRSFGVGVHNFRALRNAFLFAFQKCVDPKIYEASAGDWQNFWKLAVNLMSQGSLSGEGERLGKIYVKEWTEELLKYLSDIQKEMDRSGKVEDHFMHVMFMKAIEKDPSYKRFDYVYNSKRICQRHFDTVVLIAKSLGSPEDQTALLFELGARHITYNVTREILDDFTEPFLQAVQHYLKDDFTDPVMYYFKKLFLMTTGGMINGMDAGKNTGENKKAPDGSEPFCLLFTDIESSTNLWQRFPEVMKEAVERHHRMIRTVIADNGGYEVKTVGDSFIIAAKDVFVGMKIAVGIQLELMRHLPIAPGFEMLEEVQGGGDPSAWSNQTLRVRIGIEHCTQATATYDTIHRRYDYYGPSVNQCARIEAAAAGGQILMSRDTFKALKAIPAFHDEPCPPFLRDLDGTSAADERGLDHFVAVTDVGKLKLKGIKKRVKLFSMTPIELAGRDFGRFAE